MTIRLYNISAYDTRFTARVVAVSEGHGGYLVELDRTLFFPTAGGQSADTGTLGGHPVLDVIEDGGTLLHRLSSPLSVGESVAGEIEWSERYRKMQWHTAEHLLSGAVFRLFGLHNSGFHLGDSEMTVDFDGVLTWEQLKEAERLANSYIRKNEEVTVLYPTPEEAKAIAYRAKSEYDELRLVKIGDSDTCACCAPHVARAGECGLLTITSFLKYKGGTRLYLLAGDAAYLRLAEDRENMLAVSRLLSVPPAATGSAVSELHAECGRLRGLIGEQERLSAAACLSADPNTTGDLVLFLPFGSPRTLCDTAKAALSRGNRTAAVLAPKADGGYAVALLSNTVPLRVFAASAFPALGGRGGGSDSGVQGSFSANEAEIRAYFAAHL